MIETNLINYISYLKNINFWGLLHKTFTGKNVKTLVNIILPLTFYHRKNLGLEQPELFSGKSFEQL